MNSRKGTLGTPTQALGITPPLPLSATSCYQPKSPRCHRVPAARASISLSSLRPTPAPGGAQWHPDLLHSFRELGDLRVKRERAGWRPTRVGPTTYPGDASRGAAAPGEAAAPARASAGAGRGRPGCPAWRPRAPRPARRPRRAPRSPKPAPKQRREVESPLAAASAPSAWSPPLPRAGKSRGEGAWGGGPGRPGERTEGAAELPPTLPNDTRVQRSPLRLLLLGLKKVLIRPHTKPPTPGYERNPGILLPTALEAEGLEGRRKGMGKGPASLGLAKGQWPQFRQERVIIWAGASVWLV